MSNLEPGKLPWLVDEVLDAAHQDAAAGYGQNMSGADEAVKEPGEAGEYRTRCSANLADQAWQADKSCPGAGDTEMVSWLMERRHGADCGSECWRRGTDCGCRPEHG